MWAVGIRTTSADEDVAYEAMAWVRVGSPSAANPSPVLTPLSWQLILLSVSVGVLGAVVLATTVNVLHARARFRDDMSGKLPQHPEAVVVGGGGGGGVGKGPARWG